VSLVGLVLLLMLFGELDRVFNPRYVVTINTNHAAGLRKGSGIELNGVPIGVIDQIGTQRDSRYTVEVIALVKTSERIPINAKPFADSSLLGGSATLVLEAPHALDNRDELYLPTDGSAQISGEIRSRLIEQITAELDARMAPITEALQQFARLSENLNAMFQAPDPDSPEADRPKNLYTAMAQLSTVLDDVHEALNLAKRWLGDEQLLADGKEAVRKANTLIDSAATTIDQYSKLAATLESDADALTKKLLPVADDLASTLEEVKRVARLAREGQGSIALMLNSPDLYMSLTDAAIRLERALIDLQLLVQKIRAEGVPLDLTP
jgi:ABC-type transporter Mla subunit MlaD